MAIIATLKATENAYAGGNHSIASIPLNKLVPWDGNVRKTGGTEGLDELTASIAAVGLLQSLVVRKTSRGRFSIIAGRRRFLALSALAEKGEIAGDAPVPCRVVPGSSDATEISLTENVVRAPMHPADQFEAFRDLIDGGSSIADVAARFGISETVVKQRLKLARVSPVIFEAYRAGELSLEQVQAFTVSDDQTAQERVFSELSEWSGDPDDIRGALTQDEIAATDKRVQLVTLAAYEEAGGAVRRDLFAEDDEGVFILDPELLNCLVLARLHEAAEATRAEGWKWVETVPEIDYETRSQFARRHPERLPLSEEATAERKMLSEEYTGLFDSMEEGDEEASARLDEIESRIEELEDTECVWTPDTLAVAGAIVTIGRKGEIEVIRGLVRPEDSPDEVTARGTVAKERPAFSSSLVESLTAQKSAAISACLSSRPDIALAAVVHGFASGVFAYGNESCLQVSARRTHLREDSRATEALEQAHAKWNEKIPAEPEDLWQWCLEQDQATLLELMAFCAACTVDAVQRKQDRPDCSRIAHANTLAEALKLDLASWFTPTAENYFNRVSRAKIVSAISQAKNVPAKRSWDKLKKSELAALAEREVAGAGWLPQPLKA
jgi:ParB family chromosome partitioning protein